MSDREIIVPLGRPTADIQAEIVLSATEILQSHSQRIKALERFIWKLVVFNGVQLACLVLILVTR